MMHMLYRARIAPVVWSVCVLAVAALVPFAGRAQTATPELTWNRAPGAASDIAVGANGTVWAIGRTTVPGGFDIYRRDGSNWTRIPGGAERIAVDPQGNAWVANNAQALFRFDGNNWVTIQNQQARDVGVGANGTVWVIGNNPEPGGYGIYRSTDLGASWKKIPGGAVRISVDPQGNAWVINSTQTIFRFDGSRWVTVPGQAKDIGLGADGSVWALGTGGAVHRWEGSAWARKPGGGAQIAGGPNGAVWMVQGGGEILQAQAPLTLESTTIAIPAATTGSVTIPSATTTVQVNPVQNIPAPAQTVTINQVPVITPPTGTATTAPATVTWNAIAGAANDVGVGANGTVWVIGRTAVPGGFDIYRRGGSNWTKMPGGAVRVAVDPQGNAWVVNSNQAIFRHDGSNWIQVSGKAYDIGIGANGTVWAIGPVPEAGGYAIYRTTDKGATWTKIAGSALRISVDPAGNPWVVNNRNAIFRMEGDQWIPVAGAAKDIGVGADGAVWMVGTDGGIHRYENAAWARKPGAAAQIAAGPNGHVWVVNDAGGISQAQVAATATTPFTGQTILLEGVVTNETTVTSSTPTEPQLQVSGGEAFGGAISPVGQPVPASVSGVAQVPQNTYKQRLVGASRATCGVDGTALCPGQRALLVRNASIDCPSGSFPDLGVSSCWKCPEGYSRSIHAVDKDKACQKPDSTVVGGFLAATFQGRLCEKGSFYDPIRGGECYSCPAGYSRTATHIDAPNACYKAESFSYATRVKTTPWPHECAGGSFFDPIGGCFTCPAGYARTAYSVQTSQACAKAVNDPKPATLVKKAQCQPGEIRDLMIKGEQDVSAGGGCWTCPVATDRTILPITGDHACERAPGVRFAAATRTAPMTCEPNEIFDPINSDNSNVAQALAAHNRDFPSDPMTAKSSGGTCWICPPGSKRSAAAVYGWEACVTAMNWQPAPYNHAGLFGLVNAEPVALRLVNERTLINSVIQGIQQSAVSGSLPADYARTVWNEIATRPQDSAILKMVVLSRVMNAARQPATATPDEIALRDELAYKVQEFKIYMAQDALDAYRAWNANQSWRTGQFKQSQLAALVDIGQVPPDYELITAEKITGSLVAAGASDVALHLTLTTKAVLERLFPHMFRTTFQPVKEATRTGVMLGKAVKDIGTGTRITTEAVKTGVGGVGASIASIGPQIIVTIAIEVLAEAIQQQIEIADAEPKLKANLATAINEPVDFARLSATIAGAEVAKGYWSMVMGGPAPRADGVKPASLPPRNLAAFQAAAQVALAQ